MTDDKHAIFDVKNVTLQNINNRWTPTIYCILSVTYSLKNEGAV